MARIRVTRLNGPPASFNDLELQAVGSGTNVARQSGCGDYGYPDELPFTEVFAGGTVEGNVCWTISERDVGTLDVFHDAASPRRYSALHPIVLASSAHPVDRQTVRLGRGFAGWKLNMTWRKAADLVRYVRRPKNDGFGCSGGAALASRIDFYPTMMIAWIFWPGKPGTALTDVTTTAIGDRSGDGFVIGRSHFAEVRRKHRNARVYTRRQLGPYPAGSKLLIVYRSTGVESGVALEYWFNARNLLVALTSATGGC